MFESLTDRFEGILTRLRSRGRLTDADVDEVLREIRTALLEADVEIGVVRGFTDAVRGRCVGLELSQSLSPGQQVIKIVNEELVAILGGETLQITLRQPAPDGRSSWPACRARARPPPRPSWPAGSSSRAATRCWWAPTSSGRPPSSSCGCSAARPASPSSASRPTRWRWPRPASRRPSGSGRDVLIVDTAGRLSIDEDLMDEIRHIAGAVDPHYTFLVIDAMTGQDAVSTAAAFHDALSLDGVILTKLDGDARGGAALSVKEVVGRPIAFASTGEKLDDFDQFHPDRMADRILGMGDVLSLIEQAERTMDKDVATKGAAAIIEGRFTLEDFLEQLQQVKKMGSISGMLSLLPGVSKDLKQASSSRSTTARSARSRPSSAR